MHCLSSPDISGPLIIQADPLLASHRSIYPLRPFESFHVKSNFTYHSSSFFSFSYFCSLSIRFIVTLEKMTVTYCVDKAPLPTVFTKSLNPGATSDILLHHLLDTLHTLPNTDTQLLFPIKMLDSVVKVLFYGGRHICK